MKIRLKGNKIVIFSDFNNIICKYNKAVKDKENEAKIFD